jgi:putative ABC transport system ATP-binding protein
MEILSVRNLTKKYKMYDGEIFALNDVSFTVQKGEFIAIIGASGSGKSTLMHIIGGVDTPTSGEVVVDGVNIFKQKERKLAQYRRRKVSLVYQFYNLVPILNAGENIRLPLKLDKVTPDDKEYQKLLNSLGIIDKQYNYPHQLSGGQQQRVAIARALITAPSIILADEPTGNLDSKNSKEIIDLLRKSNRKYNQTIMIVTHNEAIAKQTDRIIEICDGKIVKDEKTS